MQLVAGIYAIPITNTLPIFSEMMSVLYNFVKVDTEVFLSNPKHIEVIISMCKTVSTLQT